MTVHMIVVVSFNREEVGVLGTRLTTLMYDFRAPCGLD